METDVGVLVARFQVDALHDGHCNLMDAVCNNHKRVLVFLGIAPHILSHSSPLDYESRERMVKSLYPNVTVLPIRDQPTDAGWAKTLNAKIREVVPVGSVTLYGGRDSFIEHYEGGCKDAGIKPFKCVELATKLALSGTDVRNQIKREVRDSADFRAGIIYASHSQYPRVFPTVDIAVVRKAGEPENRLQVLLGKKPNENKWRFPGGFADIRDGSLEQSARREVMEETNLEVTDFEYICSKEVKDWRDTPTDRIMTTFFYTEVAWGAADKAGDDLGETMWVDIDTLGGMTLGDDHTALAKELIKFIGRKGK